MVCKLQKLHVLVQYWSLNKKKNCCNNFLLLKGLLTPNPLFCQNYSPIKKQVFIGTQIPCSERATLLLFLFHFLNLHCRQTDVTWGREELTSRQQCQQWRDLTGHLRLTAAASSVIPAQQARARMDRRAGNISRRVFLGLLQKGNRLTDNWLHNKQHKYYVDYYFPYIINY